MELPQASICHRSTGRLRIKVASRRGDTDYYKKAVKALSAMRRVEHLTANPMTGSVLFIGHPLDSDEIASFAREHQVFDLRPENAAALPLMHRLVQPVANVDRSLRALTRGTIDLPGAIFCALLGTGIYQLVRGRFSAPPWYTAFWYAFGLVSLYVIEKAAHGDAARQAD